MFSILSFLLIFTSALIAGESADVEKCDITSDYDDNIGMCDQENVNIIDVNQLDLDGYVDFYQLHISRKNFFNLTAPIFVDYYITTLRISQCRVKSISNRTFASIDGLDELTLDFNELESIYDVRFQSGVSYMQLSVNYNQIKQLDAVFSPELASIRELSLTNNQIKTIAPNAFVNLRNLIKLNLKSNKIDLIDNLTFNGLTKLKELNLELNDLKLIRRNTFGNLLSLQQLYLKENLLTNIESSSFNVNNSLRLISLSQNSISSLRDVHLDELLNLKYLDIQSNQLVQFDFDQCTNLINLDVSFNDIESVQFNLNNNFLVNLDLSFLRISQLNLAVFSPLNALQYLTASFNHITELKLNLTGFNESISNLNRMDLSFNMIGRLDSGLFAIFRNLARLDLSHNMIENLTERAFEGLQSVTYLLLSFNPMTSLKTGKFGQLKRLQNLYLDNCRLSRLENDVFGRLLSLTFIDLSGNKLETVKRDHFRGLVHLSTLKLANNYLISIEPGAFRDVSALTDLDLSSNYLTNVEPNTFVGMSVTSQLNLAFNDIDRIDDRAFVNSSMINVNLTSNRLDTVQPILSQLAANITELKLNNNNLEQVHMEKSSSLRSKLYRINLAMNKIRSFRVVGDQFSNLALLNLSYNLIENLTLDDFKQLDQLIELDLSGNRLKTIESGFFRHLSQLCFIFLDDTLARHVNWSILNEFGDNLEYIDLSNNNLGRLVFDVKFTKLENLILNNVNLTRTNNVSFVLDSLTNLDLSSNRDLNYDDLVDMIGGMFDLNRLVLRGLSMDLGEFFASHTNLITLVSLDLSHNNLTTIRYVMFKNMHNMLKLDLSFNQIELIEPGSLVDLKYLHELNLESNRLVEFEFYLTGLFSINLKSNLISRYSLEFDSSELSMLNRLDFSFNRLVRVDFRFFFKRRSSLLEELSLNNNKIERVEADAFEEVTEMKTLDLSSNRIVTIEERTFKNLRSLKYLSLSDNRLERLWDRQFDSLFQLEHLNVSYNRLEVIQASLFDSLYNLIVLDLSYNRIRTIEAFSFRHLNQLVFIDVSSNFDLTLDENSLSGLDSIKNIWISYDFVNGSHETNRQRLKSSLKLNILRNVNEIVYFRSIYINYQSTIIDCALTLDYIRLNLQLNLKTEYDFNLFFINCFSFELFSS